MNTGDIRFSVFDLDESALVYFRDQLQSARTLSNRVLKSTELARGRVKTKLPAGTSKTQLKSYGQGGVIPAADVRQELVAGVVQKIQVVEPAYFYPIAQISDFLAGGPGRVCIIDNRTDSLETHGYTEGASYSLSWKGESYSVLTGDGSNLVQIEECLCTSHMLEPLLIFFVSDSALPPSSPSAIELSPSTLEEIAGKASQIIVGAYDGEGFLVWEKQP